MPLIGFDNTFARLPERLYARCAPTPVRAPKLVRINHPLAALLGIDAAALTDEAGVAVLAGNDVPDGAEPIALAYAGHQFGGFSPQLGDGRAILLGEVIGIDGARRDIQLKGSGPTPFSRGGDGRAALGPVLREYLISEAMAALGVPTTRALAAVSTGELVLRERRLPGAVLTRVAASHLRVGTFEYFAARGDTEAVRVLVDTALARHPPEQAGSGPPARRLLEAVVARQAALVAQWMLIGFVHGVMNTDNTAISGETIDYGPCAFMDAYDPATVFSSIDHAGRYAYDNQPRIAHWNCTRLAEALLPLLGGTEQAAVAAAEEVLGGFAPRFGAAYWGGLRRKLGLTTEQDGDRALIEALLAWMAQTGADWTLTFRRLGAADPSAWLEPGWVARWRERRAADGAVLADAGALDRVNPAVIPRNHQVEDALERAVDGELRPFEALLEAVSHPFTPRPGQERYAVPPPHVDPAYRTFCGT